MLKMGFFFSYWDILGIKCWTCKQLNSFTLTERMGFTGLVHLRWKWAPCGAWCKLSLTSLLCGYCRVKRANRGEMLSASKCSNLEIIDSSQRTFSALLLRLNICSLLTSCITLSSLQVVFFLQRSSSMQSVIFCIWKVASVHSCFCTL